MRDGTESDDTPTEAPATWENVVVGKAKHLLGSAVGDDELAEEGEAQEEVAHEVHEEYEQEHRD
jgi:uncharacterized protein YjbJ (UPF0337 family)